MAGEVRRQQGPFVNDGSKKAVKGVAPRHGFHEWHDAECEMEVWPMVSSLSVPKRMFWCRTHGQWCYESVTTVVYRFEDGEEVVKDA
jgi:hypothetical protein